MSYEVKLRLSAQKDLNALAGQEYEAVVKAISSLEENPRPPKVKKLADSELCNNFIQPFDHLIQFFM